MTTASNAIEHQERACPQWTNMLAQMDLGAPVLPSGTTSVRHPSIMDDSSPSLDDLFIAVFDLGLSA